jgi:hypothetical protein
MVQKPQQRLKRCRGSPNPDFGEVERLYQVLRIDFAYGKCHFFGQSRKLRFETGRKICLRRLK